MRGGSSPQKGGQAAQALGRSRGGFSTKIHVSVDGLGNPLRFILTGGQQHDITQAEELIAGYAGEHVLADKGYDAQEFRQHMSRVNYICRLASISFAGSPPWPGRVAGQRWSG